MGDLSSIGALLFGRGTRGGRAQGPTAKLPHAWYVKSNAWSIRWMPRPDQGTRHDYNPQGDEAGVARCLAMKGLLYGLEAVAPILFGLTLLAGRRVSTV
jgi:hypothetical protein